MRKMDIAADMRENKAFTLREKLYVVFRLSLPGMLAQITEIAMQYIDAAMVGALGAAASASIGLVASSTWLFGGVIRSCAAGFSVQVAHAVGAGDINKAKSIFRQSLLSSLLFSMLVMFIGMAAANVLPQWLGADPSLFHDAKMYFLAFSLFIPARQICWLCLNMLQCSGNMKIPSLFSAMECILDVIFNYFLIFPSRTVSFGTAAITLPGAGLGVLGAQLGTSLAVLTACVLGLWYAGFRSEQLSFTKTAGSWKPEEAVLQEAFRIGWPMALEQSALCAAQVMSTRIVAPLGTVAIAANSFAVTAESICYMPGYGIGSAATTLVGQSIGSGRKDLTRDFAWLTTFAGIAVMTMTGFIMYFLCPYVFAFLTPDPMVRAAGTEVLRIELLAEPLFAASIVATGALRGAGDTLVPGILNLISIWGIRITVSIILTKIIGLRGAWIAMALELSARGILFLIRLKREKWLDRAFREGSTM